MSINGAPPARIRLRRIERASGSDVSSREQPTLQSLPLWEDDVRCATVKENQRVTAEGWWQDVRNFELEIDDVDDLGENERL
jgi:hypothetical protein